MKLFFGDKEIIIPVLPDFQSISTNYHVSQMIGNDQAILVNLASFRSAYQVTVDAIESKLFSTIIVIAE
jgi:hypothetical protein